MLLAFGAVFAVYGALRIIAGWIFPADAMRSFDVGVGRLVNFVGKLCVVVLGLSILAFVIYAALH